MSAQAPAGLPGKRPNRGCVIVLSIVGMLLLIAGALVLWMLMLLHSFTTSLTGDGECGAHYALCAHDVQRFGKNTVRFQLPGREAPVILGAEDCHLERATIKGDRIDGWTRGPHADYWVPGLTVCTSQSLERNATGIDFAFCTADIGAGTPCVRSYRFHSRDAIAWTDTRNGEVSVSPLPSLFRSSPEFDRAHTLTQARTVFGVLLPPGTEVLDPQEAGNLYTEAHLSTTVVARGARFRDILYFVDGALVHGTLAANARVDGLPCSEGITFSGSRVTGCSLFARANAGDGVLCAPGDFERSFNGDRIEDLTCTLAAPVAIGHAVFETGSRATFEGWPPARATTIRGTPGTGPHALRLRGKLVPANSSIVVRGVSIEVKIGQGDSMHVPGDRCDRITSVVYDGVRTIAHGNVNGIACDRALPESALSF